MARSTFPTLVAILLVGVPALAAAPPGEARGTGRPLPDGLAARVWAITETVLDHHLHPPARQQMILAGLEAVYRAAGANAPAGLARRVSALEGAETLTPLLEAAWGIALPEKVTARLPRRGDPIETLFLEGLLAPIDGGARLLSEKERKVAEQFAGNHYVGLQIALAYDQEAKRPKVASVLKGGPADRAGLVEGDLIEEIDGVTTEGMEIAETVDRLRGALGTTVVIRVRQAAASQSRTINVTRGLLPRQTVKGIRQPGQSEYLVDGPGSIGYVKFDDLLGSTPHELRRAAERLDAEGARAVVLDLRSVSGNNVHAAVLLADCLLEQGTIGAVRRAGRVETFQAEPDALFRSLPLAVLVDSTTSASGVWIAAALQDNGRAAIFGPAPPNLGDRRDPGEPVFRRPVRTIGPRGTSAEFLGTVPIGDGDWSIEMITGRLERGDGRAVAITPSPGTHLAAETAGPPGRHDGHDDQLVVAGEFKDRLGLVPDVAVLVPNVVAPGRPAAGPRPAPGGTENAATSGGDALLSAALRHLRALSKTP
jgi:carboxyl-terminal processing protease